MTAYHATKRIEREMKTGILGANFLERLLHQRANGLEPCVAWTHKVWSALGADLGNMLDVCSRQNADDWRSAVSVDRIFHNSTYISAMCDSLVRVPPEFDVTCIPYPNEAPHVHEAFKRAQTQIERNRALAQIAAFSRAVVDGDGAIRARVAGFLV